MSLSDEFLSNVRGSECVATRAANVWEIGKFCGLDFPGMDEEEIEDSVNHLKTYHQREMGMDSFFINFGGGSVLFGLREVFCLVVLFVVSSSLFLALFGVLPYL